MTKVSQLMLNTSEKCILGIYRCRELDLLEDVLVGPEGWGK